MKNTGFNRNIYLSLNKSSRIDSYRFQSCDSRIRFVDIFLNKMNDEEYRHCFYFFSTFLTILNYDVKIFPLGEDHQHHNISTFYQEKQQLEKVDKYDKHILEGLYPSIYFLFAWENGKC